MKTLGKQTSRLSAVAAAVAVAVIGKSFGAFLSKK